MLLRSSSTPTLNSWRPHSKDSSLEPELRVLQRTKSIFLTNSFHSHLLSDDRSAKKDSSQALQETRKKASKLLTHCKKDLSKKDHTEDSKREEAMHRSGVQRLFSSSGLGERFVNGERKEKDTAKHTLVMGGGARYGGGAGICSGVGGGGGSDGVDEDGECGFHGSESSDRTDAYYQKMIEANPDNALLLGNYAKFLKEIKGDFAKAEEFYGRAILAEPGDGNILSLYADLIWKSQKDAQRAETYFDQAAKSAPDDCHVLASYAKFLWDAEEDEENEKGEDQLEINYTKEPPSPGFIHGQPYHPPLAAAS